nr:hypothetical protein Iba_chr09dCG0730 [Ipomoea batatas]
MAQKPVPPARFCRLSVRKTLPERKQRTLQCLARGRILDTFRRVSMGHSRQLLLLPTPELLRGLMQVTTENSESVARNSTCLVLQKQPAPKIMTRGELALIVIRRNGVFLCFSLRMISDGLLNLDFAFFKNAMDAPYDIYKNSAYQRHRPHQWFEERLWFKMPCSAARWISANKVDGESVGVYFLPINTIDVGDSYVLGKKLLKWHKAAKVSDKGCFCYSLHPIALGPGAPVLGIAPSPIKHMDPRLDSFTRKHRIDVSRIGLQSRASGDSLWRFTHISNERFCARLLKLSCGLAFVYLLLYINRVMHSMSVHSHSRAHPLWITVTRTKKLGKESSGLSISTQPRSSDQPCSGTRTVLTAMADLWAVAISLMTERGNLILRPSMLFVSPSVQSSMPFWPGSLELYLFSFSPPLLWTTVAKIELLPRPSASAANSADYGARDHSWNGHIRRTLGMSCVHGFGAAFTKATFENSGTEVNKRLVTGNHSVGPNLKHNISFLHLCSRNKQPRLPKNPAYNAAITV